MTCQPSVRRLCRFASSSLSLLFRGSPRAAAPCWIARAAHWPHRYAVSGVDGRRDCVGPPHAWQQRLLVQSGGWGGEGAPPPPRREAASAWPPSRSPMDASWLPVAIVARCWRWDERGWCLQAILHCLDCLFLSVGCYVSASGRRMAASEVGCSLTRPPACAAGPAVIGTKLCMLDHSLVTHAGVFIFRRSSPATPKIAGS